MLSTYRGWSQIVGFFAPFAVFIDENDARADSHLLLFFVVAVAAVLSLRYIKKLVPVIHELRADTEACSDPASQTTMLAMLREATAQDTTSRLLKARVATLTGDKLYLAPRWALTIVAASLVVYFGTISWALLRFYLSF